MSKELDNVISNWNQKIADDNIEAKAEFQQSVFDELQFLAKQLDDNPEKFESFSAEKDGHLDACIEYSKTNKKCICHLILKMVKESIRIREQFRSQFREEENNNE
ncbi:hypothetical protein CMI37_06000 [Candidatus Pacearchaeota archaeon]|nr:hypothetical protein [Candidatus Pacearchaeota archaeon]|tara:strand:+ start:1213 stop:1527 length:315 start_codon:yes stop_codon:yes gene_type:complete